MTPLEVVTLVVGSAVVAAVVSGFFALSTTNALIRDQRAERREAADRESRSEARASIAEETEQFVNRYVTGGLEMVASQLDRASHQIDLSHRRAMRLRAMTRGVSDEGESQTSLRELIELRGILDPPQADAVHITQSSLIPFPGDLMQTGLLLNRCIALADDFLQRYAWTKDEKLDSVEKYLIEIKTVLAASARHYEAAAVVIRQAEPRRYSEWADLTLRDSRLVGLGTQLAEMVQSLLAREPEVQAESE